MSQLTQVPNIADISSWLASRRNHDSALTYMVGAPKTKLTQFDESFRPVPLKREVIGFDVNQWTANKQYDAALFDKVGRYSERKPVLIFCGTRKACQVSAEVLCEAYKQQPVKPWSTG